MRADCVFCKIGRGDIAAHRVHEDETTVAFLDVAQVTPGHVIVAVRTHHEAIADLSPEQAAALFGAAHRMARAVTSALKPAGLTLLHASGVAGWPSVPHLHLHVLPRYANDGVHVTWPRNHPPADELARLAGQIRSV
jgi:histidine triad (HIT) family protein